MDRNRFAIVIFLILIVADVSNASLIFNLRSFVTTTKDSVPVTPATVPGSVTGENKLNPNSVNQENKLDPKSVNPIDKDSKLDKKVNETGTDSKLDQKPATETRKKRESDPNSVNGTHKGTELDPKPVNETSEGKKLDRKSANEASEGTKKRSDPEPVNEATTDKKIDPKPVNEASAEKDSDPKVVNGVTTEKKANPETVSEVSKGNEMDPKAVNEAGKEQTVPSPPSSKTEEKENKSDPGSVTDETCDGLNPSCNIQKDLIACIKSFDDGSKVIVQNKGESNLKANLSVENSLLGLEIPKKQSKLIPLQLANRKHADVLLSSGNKKCSLPLSSVSSEANYYLRFPSYDKLVTPVNGAYLLIFTVVIFGGMWTCIKFSRRRRQGGGIPYQELEMGLPESVSAADVETAEGWDQGWDDDWDEDNAVKSPGGRHVASISANGLTSRSPNKDGWEDNWDD
ncbi:hypothetical protein PanWU01x14_151520 [Parasponia andersonii]|uniref:DUF7356 domain-containing protein n=1 Tax=Parasponia andersonii TaxID=3476 RepID=A0A2P5CHM1_PARAD|nr:hypothetical protein PanWU01x14_151520 [Parasponia andersonii]